MDLAEIDGEWRPREGWPVGTADKVRSDFNAEFGMKAKRRLGTASGPETWRAGCGGILAP